MMPMITFSFGPLAARARVGFRAPRVVRPAVVRAVRWRKVLRVISDAEVGQSVADGVHNLDEARVRVLKPRNRGIEAPKREVEELRILFSAGGFVRGDFGKASDALRFFTVGFCERRDL